MRVRACEAKNPDTCRVHGRRFNPETGNFTPRRPLVEHQEEASRFLFLLTDEQKKALRAYAGPAFNSITRHLYGRDVSDVEETKKIIAVMDEAIAAYEQVGPEKERVVYRATRLKSDELISSPEERDRMVAERFKVGSTVSMDGFMSTTENPEALFDFLPDGYEDYAERPQSALFAREKKTRESYIDMMGGDESLNNVVYEIRTTSGVPMSGFDHIQADREQEYLLGRGKKFKVMEVIPFTGLNNPGNSSILKRRHATVVRLVEVKN